MRKQIASRFGFYSVLTDPIKGYEYLTELLVDSEIPFVQLRMKNATEKQIIETALRLRKITENSNTLLIINDNPRIAKEVGADGAHIGQDDMSYEEARSIVGDMIIGISTHSPEQTKNACALGPDYIGVGPVFPTPTKQIADPAIGLEGMREMVTASTVPAVCIGGIDLSNLASVLEHGARNFCMVRQLTQSENPKRVLAEIKRIYSQFYSLA